MFHCNSTLACFRVGLVGLELLINLGLLCLLLLGFLLEEVGPGALLLVFRPFPLILLNNENLAVLGVIGTPGSMLLAGVFLSSGITAWSWPSS